MTLEARHPPLPSHRTVAIPLPEGVTARLGKAGDAPSVEVPVLLADPLAPCDAVADSDAVAVGEQLAVGLPVSRALGVELPVTDADVVWLGVKLACWVEVPEGEAPGDRAPVGVSVAVAVGACEAERVCVSERLAAWLPVRLDVKDAV